MTDLPCFIHGPAGGTRPSACVVLLHGLGADGADLIELAPALAETLPGAVFLAPDGPQPCDLAPFGRQWFSLQSRLPADLTRGIEAASPVLAGFLQATLDRFGLPASALALVGFSQGAMMALHTGLRMVEPPAALVGLSGRFLAAGDLPAASRPPVLLVHGEADDVVPFSEMAAARQALARLGVPVEAHARPGLGHAIDPEVLQLTGRFLRRHLPMGASPGPQSRGEPS
ncbi:MAG TPA: prolyl oligopeptidase family serine peptidase [Geminicoccus sp.]|uniref:alpha/beta hydrolase n=1 Tax=Geminicoccus sp. TaxID=2024832 RepID=UPI002C998BDB|nr:prolyl oligopeptidase family serine peptidase [Geminicoccus sp.]HWL67107.1 prolyl oligopeptidase family serine peptidase [Geminicoccus sp.]